MFLAAGLRLLLRQLPHLLLDVPQLSLHALVLLLLPVLRRARLVPLLGHLLQVLLQPAHQALGRTSHSHRFHQPSYIGSIDHRDGVKSEAQRAGGIKNAATAGSIPTCGPMLLVDTSLDQSCLTKAQQFR